MGNREKQEFIKSKPRNGLQMKLSDPYGANLHQKDSSVIIFCKWSSLCLDNSVPPKMVNKIIKVSLFPGTSYLAPFICTDTKVLGHRKDDTLPLDFIFTMYDLVDVGFKTQSIKNQVLFDQQHSGSEGTGGGGGHLRQFLIRVGSTCISQTSIRSKD